MSNSKVVIIGSGGAGLAAAHELIPAGYQVILLEKEDHVGGRATTVDWHGFKLETGASVLTSQDKPVLDNVKKYGLELIPAPGGLIITVPKDGQLYSANFLNPFSLFTWKGISLSARLSILKLLPAIVGRMLKLKGDPYHLESGDASGDDISYSTQFANKINAELLNQCFYPMMETMMAYEKDDLSWKAFLSLMAVYMGGKSMTIKGGMSALTSKLAEGVEIHLNSEVKNVKASQDNKMAIVTYTGDGQSKTIECDKVIFAVQGNKILNLIDPANRKPEWDKMFNSIRYSSGAMQYLLLKTTFKPKVEMVYLPPSTGHKINQISFEAQNDSYLLAMTDPRVGTDWQKHSDEELAHISMEVIATYFPELKGTLEDQIIFRWPTKVVTLGPGYLTALAEFKKDPKEDPFYFAGDWHNSPTFAGAMTSGIEAAKRLMAADFTG